MGARNVVRMHYVPRLLLEHFADSQGLLHVYHIDEKRWFNPNPGHFGLEKNMYSQDVDKWLEREIEALAGEVFKKVRTGDTDLSEDERLTIARFISWQAFRTRLARERISGDDPEYLCKMFEDETFSSETLETLLGRPLTFEEREELKRRSLLSRTDPKEALEALRKIREEGAEDDFPFLLNQKMVGDKNPTHIDNQDVVFFMRLAWRIILAERESFILSDNPVTITPPSGLGIDSPEFECVLPISKKVAIHIGRNKNLSGQDVELVSSDKAVKRINPRTLGNAYQFAISPRKDSWIKKTMHRKPTTYLPLRFSHEIIDVQYGRPPCPNCVAEFTPEHWDSWEGNRRPIRGYKGLPPHECLPAAN